LVFMIRKCSHPAILLEVAMTRVLTLGRGLCLSFPFLLDCLRGSSVKMGTIQRSLAWPLHKDDTHKSRSVIIFGIKASAGGRIFSNHEKQADPQSRKGSQKDSAELAGFAAGTSRPIPDLLAMGRSKLTPIGEPRRRIWPSGSPPTSMAGIIIPRSLDGGSAFLWSTSMHWELVSRNFVHQQL
jgi:hypothetical protein